MTSWLRKLGLSAVALSFALAVTGCDDGAGSRLLRLFFGINGLDNCTRVVVTVDLSSVGAEVERDSSGELECAINPALSTCSFDFQTVGGDLIVTVDNCTIPAVTNLFNCLIRGGSLNAIRSVTIATCDGDDVDICVSEDFDPTSCEDCDNNRDDDNDGLTDCEDPACQDDPACDVTTTLPTTSTSTTTTSSSTTTTTQSSTTTSSTTITTTSTTTSTTLPPSVECDIVFRVPDDQDLGSLQYDTDYSSAPGFFLGSGGNVECASLVDGAFAEFNDQDDQELLTTGIISLDGFSAPTDVAECIFRGFSEPISSDFDITVTDASDPNLSPVTVDVIVSQIDCRPIGATTTTTTLGETTTTTTPPTTVPGTTTTTIPSGTTPFVIEFVVDNDTDYGALQFDVGYAPAPGEWATSGANLVCEDRTGGFGAFNDDMGADVLSVGIINLSGFSGPLTVAACQFDATGTPVPGDFSITVTDSSAPDTTPADAPPMSVAVTAGTLD